MKKEIVRPGLSYLINYGKINVDVKSIMDAKNINRNALAKAVETRFEVADKWYHNRVERMDLDLLARICCYLNCEPGDILRYEKAEENDEPLL